MYKRQLLTYAMYFIIPLSMFYIYRTRYGLKLRALGENPAALDAAGENVFAMRYGYITVSYTHLEKSCEEGAYHD